MRTIPQIFRNSCAICAVAFLFYAQLGSAQGAKASDGQTFRVGLKSIAISSPAPDLVETGSDYRVVVEILAPASNRLVAAFVHPEDLQKLTGGSADLSQYALVEVPRRAEFATVTPELFKQVSDGMAQQFGALVNDTIKDSQEELNRKLKSLSGKESNITLDKPLMLGTLFSGPDASGFGMILQLDVNGTQKKMAAGVTVIRVRERILFLYTYAEYVNEDTVKWIRTTSEQWAASVLKANQ